MSIVRHTQTSKTPDIQRSAEPCEQRKTLDPRSKAGAHSQAPCPESEAPANGSTTEMQSFSSTWVKIKPPAPFWAPIFDPQPPQANASKHHWSRSCFSRSRPRANLYESGDMEKPTPRILLPSHSGEEVWSRHPTRPPAGASKIVNRHCSSSNVAVMQNPFQDNKSQMTSAVSDTAIPIFIKGKNRLAKDSQTTVKSWAHELEQKLQTRQGSDTSHNCRLGLN